MFCYVEFDERFLSVILCMHFWSVKIFCFVAIEMLLYRHCLKITVSGNGLFLKKRKNLKKSTPFHFQRKTDF